MLFAHRTKRKLGSICECQRFTTQRQLKWLGMMDITTLLEQCQGRDTFYYLYHLRDNISVFNFDIILYHMTCLAKTGKCTLKDINWLINLLMKNSARICRLGIYLTKYYWTESFRNLLLLNCPMRRIHKLCGLITNPYLQRDIWYTICDSCSDLLENHLSAKKWQRRLKKLDREIAYGKKRVEQEQINIAHKMVFDDSEHTLSDEETD